jgi:hypothetical protein
MRAGWMNLRCGRGSVLGGGRASWPSVAGNAANVTVGRAGLLLVRVDSSILSVGVCGKVEQTQTQAQTPAPTGGERKADAHAHAHAERQTRLLDVSRRRPPTSAAAADADAVPRKAGLAEWPGQMDQTDQSASSEQTLIDALCSSRCILPAIRLCHLCLHLRLRLHVQMHHSNPSFHGLAPACSLPSTWLATLYSTLLLLLLTASCPPTPPLPSSISPCRPSSDGLLATRGLPVSSRPCRVIPMSCMPCGERNLVGTRDRPLSSPCVAPLTTCILAH